MQYQTPYADMLPSLSDDEYKTLKEDIARRGVLVPVVVDEFRNVIDGHHRIKIAAELQLADYPVDMRSGLSDEEKASLAWDLNAHRRHMTREARQEVARKLRARGYSYRRIGDMLGVTQVTAMHDTEGVKNLTPDAVVGADGKHYPSVRLSSSTVDRVAPLLSEGPAAELARKLGISEAEKIVTLERLHRTSGSPDSNGTFQEICETGGFAWGDDMDKWCNFAQAPMSEVTKGLLSISEHHKIVHVSQNSGDEEWYTPPEIVDRVRQALGGIIDLDPCSCREAQDVVKARNWYNKEQDGRSIVWSGRVFMNPPYTRGVIDDFVDKLLTSKGVCEYVTLTNNSTESNWGQCLLSQAVAVCFPSGRISFWGLNKEAAKPLQGQMITYRGPSAKRFASAFFGLGDAWIR